MRPDIIFLVLDTQRADRLGCYQDGSQPTITPNLDRFAAESLLFQRAISPAQWTVPSHGSMFTGLYPTAHQVLQSNRTLPQDRPHLAETLQAAGYETIGFCNNPLVGILNNGFKRGFETFYNYGGAIPSLPKSSTRLPWPLNRILEAYTQFLRRISYPIQNFFGQSDLAFSVSLNTWLTPLWSKFANFKGQNERSVRDLCLFLQEREQERPTQPLFLFVNLMETHLPFWPPGTLIDKVAPYLRTDREARTIMHQWNREAYRWAAPLPEPLAALESRVLSDMYNAEVAYQDSYLGPLFDTLAGRSRRNDTLTLIVADHGDSLGEHRYFGHAFTGYQELVHVPLMLHWPGRLPARSIPQTVSTRRVYHTMLDAAAPLPATLPALDPAEVSTLSLSETLYGRNPDQNAAMSEIYPPLNFVKAIQHRQPELVEPFRVTSVRRSLVRDNLKLIQVDGRPDELFDLDADPAELVSLTAEKPDTVTALNNQLNWLTSQVELQRDSLAAGSHLAPETDEHVLQRLRGLGYIE